MRVPRLQLALSFLVAGSALGMGWFLLRESFFASPARLIQKAYSEQRTVELRLGKAPHSALRVQRGPQATRMERPASLLEAEAAIARGLRNHPEDPALLAARGQANLLEWAYEAAITDMQEALDTQPKSAAVLNGLASAYFERAEAEDRFEDYGTAFELQSRALQHSHDDPVLLFNRAITGSRLFLFKQSIEDFERYLGIDSSSEWADEVKQRLNEVRGIVEAHDQRTKAPLLTPAEFVQQVDPARRETWEKVEPRIEEYLSVAITDWLPAAWPVEGKGVASQQATRALRSLAVILQKNHDDSWLGETLADIGSPPFPEALAALSAALTSDNAAQNYELGLDQSQRAVSLFLRAHSRAGLARAQFEEVYGLHFTDAAPKCIEKGRELNRRLRSSKYRWIEIQLALEASVCLGMQGELGNAFTATVDAHRKAKVAHYPSLSLRATGFWAADLGEKGQRREAWRVCSEGLKEYWRNSTRPVPGYNLYIFMGELAAYREPWFLELVSGEQALSLLPASQYPTWSAFEHSHLASIASKAELVDAAQEHLSAAERLFALAPKTEVTENVRLGTQVEVAELHRKDESAEVVLARLQSMSSRLDKISNFSVVSDYFRALGKLQREAGLSQASEESFERAAALMEQQRASLHSEDDRATWNEQAVEAYRELAETKLGAGDLVGGLAVWQIYRNGPSQASGQAESSLVNGSSDSQILELRQAIADEINLLEHRAATLGDSVSLTYIPLTDGFYVWRYDAQGVGGTLLQSDPSSVRMLAARFAELCSTSTSPMESILSISRDLYRTLIAPVAGDLREGQVLLIDAAAPLSPIPFQALVGPDGRYLPESHPIVYFSGLRHLTGLESQWSEPLAESHVLVVASAIADGDLHLLPLTDATAEAQDVASHFQPAKLLIGGEASIPNVLNALPEASVFHYAGHAGISAGRTGIFLAPGTEGSSFAILDSSALSKVRLPKLKLAVLSACSTESGMDGVLIAPQSLAGAFLRAGVPHVIATRWNVDSSASRMFVRAFYGALTAGSYPPRAVALAQQHVRAIDSHPYYWAAFDDFGSP